jgi:hypothetical protein
MKALKIVKLRILQYTGSCQVLRKKKNTIEKVQAQCNSWSYPELIRCKKKILT